MSGAGKASAVVTNPISKSVLYRAGFRHPGHTEFLAELAGHGGPVPQPVMMPVVADTFAVVPVTIHLSLREALAPALDRPDRDNGPHRGRVTSRRGFEALANPRLAKVSGLNPHAGEDGSPLGTEDIDIVTPAIEDAAPGRHRRARRLLPADTKFHAAARKTYIGAICMYHDQALIPIKTIAFEDAVNVDAGLAVRRTSPDHGTAFDIRRHRQGQSARALIRSVAARRADGGNQSAMSAIDDLPPLRDVIREHSSSARKSLGQHFLLDLNLTGRPLQRAAGLLLKAPP